MLLKTKLRSTYCELVGERSSEGNVTVQTFMDYFTDQQCGKTTRFRRAILKRVAAYIAALLETFQVEARNGEFYFVQRPPCNEGPLQRERGAACQTEASSRRSHRRPRRRLHSLVRYVRPRPLVVPSYDNIRITQCMYEDEFVKVNFVLKKDEPEIRCIQATLNDENFGPHGKLRCYRGLICAAPDNASQEYCRVVVLNYVTGEPDCLVRFLEFGFEDYVNKNLLRILPRDMLRKAAHAYKGVVVNSPQTKYDRQQMAFDMRNSDQTRVRLLTFSKDEKCYELYVYTSADSSDDDID